MGLGIVAVSAAYAGAVILTAVVFYATLVRPHENKVAKDLRAAQAEIVAARGHHTEYLAVVLGANTAGAELEVSLARARQTIAITSSGGAR